MYTGQYNTSKSFIPPSYRVNAFTSVPDYRKYDKEAECNKTILTDKFGKQELLLCTLIVILAESGADELTVIMLCIIFAVGLK